VVQRCINPPLGGRTPSAASRAQHRPRAQVCATSLVGSASTTATSSARSALPTVMSLAGSTTADLVRRCLDLFLIDTVEHYSFLPHGCWHHPRPRPARRLMDQLNDTVSAVQFFLNFQPETCLEHAHLVLLCKERRDVSFLPSNARGNI
jgi:hypothetical protein